VRHRLLVVRAIGRQVFARGIERFAETRHIAMAEDGEHASEQTLDAPVDLDALLAEKAHHCLRGGQTHDTH